MTKNNRRDQEEARREAGLLAGKVALITGGGAGFGAATAKRFADEGARVALADINIKQAQGVAAAIGGEALAIKADVTRSDDTAQMVEAVERHFGALDIFVANAGFAHRQMPLADIEEDVFDLVLAVNVKALYHASRHLVPLMVRHGGGSIITLGATLATHPRPGFAWFGAAKGFVMAATRAMAVELAAKNIRVNALCPAEADTATFETFYGTQAAGKRQELSRHIPLGRLSTPEDIANAALWLASDQSAFTTGAFLPVDGGYHL